MSSRHDLAPQTMDLRIHASGGITNKLVCKAFSVACFMRDVPATIEWVSNFEDDRHVSNPPSPPSGNKLEFRRTSTDESVHQNLRSGPMCVCQTIISGNHALPAGPCAQSLAAEYVQIVVRFSQRQQNVVT